MMSAFARFASNERIAASLAFGAILIASSAAVADNPIVQTNYTADPAPMVYDGRLYLYTSHDEDVTVGGFFTMNDWRLYSTTDMVNWTDHGSPAGYKTFKWGTGDAWAPHGVARNGKFYLYVPINNSTGAKIGVAVANSPWGPFSDPLGKALVSTGTGDIDPNVFVDDDGQAYLYWGNPNLWYVKLNTDMTSYAGSPTKTSLTTAGFGTRSNTDRATAYEEGPWFYKRGSLYYMVYPADGTPEKISYSTSTGPLGPWTYRGDIMAKETGTGSSFTNHPGVIDYQGHSYFFYHNAALPGGGGYKRSVCVEEFTYNADGTIPTVKMTTGGPASLGPLDPYQQVEAETIAFSSGLKTETCSEGGQDVTSISNGDYIKVKGVGFGTGAISFDARVASAGSGGAIELRLDSQTGTLIGTCTVPGTGGAQTWMTKSCTVSGVTGVHDLFLKFTGGSGSSLFNFNWWKFTPKDAPDGGTPDASATGGAGAGGAGGGAAGTSGRGGAGGVPGAGGGGRAGGAAGTTGSAGTGGTGTGGAGGPGGATATGGAGDSGGSGGATAPGRGGTSGGLAGAGVAGTSGTGTAGSAAAGTSGTGTAGSGTSGAAGSPGDGGGSSGCSCQSSPGRGDAPATVLLLLMAIAFRRQALRAARSRHGAKSA